LATRAATASEPRGRGTPRVMSVTGAARAGVVVAQLHDHLPVRGSEAAYGRCSAAAAFGQGVCPTRPVVRLVAVGLRDAPALRKARSEPCPPIATPRVGGERGRR
jgi:hypothetical protein